eukprot:4976688-Pyramimonas_sp.AAC.1
MGELLQRPCSPGEVWRCLRGVAHLGGAIPQALDEGSGGDAGVQVCQASRLAEVTDEGLDLQIGSSHLPSDTGDHVLRRVNLGSRHPAVEHVVGPGVHCPRRQHWPQEGE